MNPAPRLKAHVWLMVLLCACGFLLWTNLERAQRVHHVSQTDGEAAAIDPSSPTGYSNGRRWLIVPERNNQSYQWIAQTQQMLAEGTWRVRHVDYDNPPTGRAVHSASPTRWWLGALASIDHALSGQPRGLAVERVTLWSEPLLHFLLLVATTVFVARRFGQPAAIVAAVGFVAVYPFGAGFLPGVPDDDSLARICVLWSVLPLLAALTCRNAQPSPTKRDTRRLFILAGLAGGIGLWISARHQAPVLFGVTLGGLAAAWIRARNKGATNGTPLPWRSWALAGAITSVVGYLIEYVPSHPGLRLEVNHPLYALAWLGAGEMLAQVEMVLRQDKAGGIARHGVILVAALAAIAALPVVMQLRGIAAPWAGDLLSSRLTFLPDGVVAGNLADWLHRDGFSGPFVATCLPFVVLVGLAAWSLARRGTDLNSRAALALGLGPAAAAFALAHEQLAWWTMADAVVLALACPIALTVAPLLTTTLRRGLAAGLAALVMVPGVWQLRPLPSSGDDFAFTPLEVVSLVERSLAHWIADHAGPDGAVILAPPDRTISLCFHGGFRGLGSGDWENREGLAAAGRIATSITGDEAQARLGEHGITHIVLPSWDTDLDQFARWRLSDPDDAFIMALHHWALPVWLHPLPYKLPTGAGLDNETVAVFQVTDDTNRPAAVARLAEYFIESGQMTNAATLVPALQEFPTDLGALAALAQVQKATGRTSDFTQTLGTIQASVAAGADRALAWDRRVSLAITLALGGHKDQARVQVERCLERLTDERIRGLTTGSLFRLLTLSRAYDLPFGDEQQHALALKLLPAELRARL